MKYDLKKYLYSILSEMPLPYCQNKKHIDAWRAKNPDQHRANCRVSQHKYQVWKKIKFEFFKILLEVE